MCTWSRNGQGKGTPALLTASWVEFSNPNQIFTHQKCRFKFLHQFFFPHWKNPPALNMHHQHYLSPFFPPQVKAPKQILLKIQNNLNLNNLKSMYSNNSPIARFSTALPGKTLCRNSKGENFKKHNFQSTKSGCWRNWILLENEGQ